MIKFYGRQDYGNEINFPAYYVTTKEQSTQKGYFYIKNISLELEIVLVGPHFWNHILQSQFSNKSRATDPIHKTNKLEYKLPPKFKYTLQPGLLRETSKDRTTVIDNHRYLKGGFKCRQRWKKLYD